MVEIADVERVTGQVWGSPYQNPKLESKRKTAIQWLRSCSKRGWVVDRKVQKKEPE